MTLRLWMRSFLCVSSLCVGVGAQPPPVADAAASTAEPASPAAELALSPSGPAPPKPVLSPRTPKAAGFALRGLGARGSAALLEGGGRDEAVWNGGGDLYERGAGVLRLEQFSGRYFDELWIGYGSEGLRYQLAGQLGFGGIWLVDGTQGPVARLALRGELRREGGVYSSEARLPGGEVGYFWNRGNRQLEILGHAGWTLTGRFNPEGQNRDLRGMSYGSSLSIGWGRARLDADVSWVDAHDALGALLHGRAHFCGLSRDRWGGTRTKAERRRDVGRPPPPPGWAICADFRVLQGRTALRAGEDEATFTTQYVGGLSVVLGQVGHL